MIESRNLKKYLKTNENLMLNFKSKKKYMFEYFTHIFLGFLSRIKNNRLNKEIHKTYYFNNLIINNKSKDKITWRDQNDKYLLYLLKSLQCMTGKFFISSIFYFLIGNYYIDFSFSDSFWSISKYITYEEKFLTFLPFYQTEKNKKTVILFQLLVSKQFQIKLNVIKSDKLFTYSNHLKILKFLVLRGLESNFFVVQILPLLFNISDNNVPEIRMFGFNLLHQFLEKLNYKKIQPYALMILKILKRNLFWKKMKLNKIFLPIIFNVLERLTKKYLKNDLFKILLTDILKTYLIEIYQVTSLNSKLIDLYSISTIDYLFFEGPITCSKLGQFLFVITILLKNENMEILQVLMFVLRILISICWARIKKYFGTLVLLIFHITLIILKIQTKKNKTLLLEIQWLLILLNNIDSIKMKSFEYVIQKIPELNNIFYSII